VPKNKAILVEDKIENGFDIQEDTDILDNEEEFSIEPESEEIPDNLEISISSLTDDSLKDFINKIDKYKPLSREEEYELGKRIQQNDKEALNKLVLSNIKFVVSMANRYKNAGVSLSDLINQGNLGLIEAARRFDPEKV